MGEEWRNTEGLQPGAKYVVGFANDLNVSFAPLPPNVDPLPPIAPPPDQRDVRKFGRGFIGI